MKQFLYLFIACSVLLTGCDRPEQKPQVQHEGKPKEKELEKHVKPHTDPEKKG